jgi:hypothetical protein
VANYGEYSCRGAISKARPSFIFLSVRADRLSFFRAFIHTVTLPWDRRA